MDLWKTKILFRGVWVFRGCKSKMNPWKSSRPIEKIGRWTCWWNKSLLKFFGPKRLLFNGPLLWTPGWMCQKAHWTINQKPTIRIRLPLWWNLAPIQVGWYFRFPESFLFRGGGGELGCADFFIDDQILPEGFTFFCFQNLVREYHFFGYYTNAPRIEIMLLRDVFVCPLHDATNEERHQFKWDWLFQIAFCLFFFRDIFPLLNPYPSGEVKQQKSKT